MRILFVTWDGPQVNYLESLFLPIFKRLEDHNFFFDILQFRWGDPSLAATIERQCSSLGIGYRAQFIHRKPPVIGPFASAFLGARWVREAVKDYNTNVIMPRSLLPAMAVLRSGEHRLRPVIFDRDGLDADERIDFGRSSRLSPVYRLLRTIERLMVRQSKTVLVRTEFAAKVLSQRSGMGLEHFHVVSNGRDKDVFAPGRPTPRESCRQWIGVSQSAPLLVYAGSVGPQYKFDQIGAYVMALRKKREDAHVLILTGSPEAARTELQRFSSSVLEFATIMRVEPHLVARYLAASDVGVAFRSRSFSTGAIAPVKLGEYLLSGIPVIGTPFVGNTAPATDAGIFFDEAQGPDAAASWIVETILPRREETRTLARKVGLEHFSLERSVHDYLSALGTGSKPLDC